jgi:predicted alpha/beta-hydrolase family hydrolase
VPPAAAKLITIAVDDTQRVSGLWMEPPRAKACFIVAHGAGAGMRHAFLESVATELAEQGIATLRFQFPYMERGSKRTDPPKLCHDTVRAAVAEAARRTPLPLFAGGRSFGGRMTSQAHAVSPLERIRGLGFLGFPLHPAKRPSDERAQHLFEVHLPMLFLQGTRDELADLQLLEALISRLGTRATLKLFPDADHSFHVPAKTGRKDSQVLSELTATLANWISDRVQSV